MAQQEQRAGDFGRLAAEARPGFVREFWDFLKDNRKWWLLPILVVFLLVGMLLVLGGTAAAPFIYTLYLIPGRYRPRSRSTSSSAVAAMVCPSGLQCLSFGGCVSRPCRKIGVGCPSSFSIEVP